MKRHFNEEFIMTKKGNEDCKNSTKCWVCDNYYNENDVKETDHCHMTGKYRNCNINLKLNHKVAVVFHNLKRYDSHLIKQELGKFNLKINVIRMDTSSSIRHRFDVEIPRGNFIKISLIFNGKSTWKL